MVCHSCTLTKQAAAHVACLGAYYNFPSVYSPYLVCHPLIIRTLSPFSSSMLGLHECISKAVSVVVRFCSIIKSSFSPPLIYSSSVVSCLLPLFYQYTVIFNMNLESSDRQYIGYLYENSELIYFRFTST